MGRRNEVLKKNIIPACIIINTEANNTSYYNQHTYRRVTGHNLTKEKRN